MNPEQFRTIDDLLQAALSRPAAERNPFLEQACADDELRREVSALLDTHEHEGVLDVGVAPLVAEITSPVGLRLIEGERLGPYEVLGALGAGSMGDVYLANDVRLGRRVALKLLPHEWTDDPRQTSRFEKEARAASALNHPNIITVYDVGVVDGHRFMAAEYVDGETLRARLSLITLREALDITTQIARGLAAAHAAGIVHRDVKPENVMVRRDGLVKIVDFGLAKLVASGPLSAPPSESIPGMVLGTAAYMSAEQAQGIEVDARSDIFSVGVVLFEMLVGHAPFAGTSSSEVIASILRDNPSAISQLRHDLPRALDRIVSRALEKDPERRYQRIEDLRTDLERVAADLQDLPTATRVTPPWNWRRASRALDGAVLAARRRPRVVLGLAVVVAASVITFGSLSRPPTVHSIVVLPFAAERGDQDADIVAQRPARANTGAADDRGRCSAGQHGTSRGRSGHSRKTRRGDGVDRKGLASRQSRVRDCLTCRRRHRPAVVGSDL
jgi:serine/threonine protein kinase